MNSWQTMKSVEILTALTDLEKQFYVDGVQPLGADGRNVAFELMPLLDSGDWAVRTKALLTIGRLGDAAVAPQILAWLGRMQSPDLQLQALDCWWQLPLTVDEREAGLCELLDTVIEPIVVRAVAFLVAKQGGLAMARRFAEFVVGSKAMVVRDELLSDGWFKLAEALSAAEIAALQANIPGFAAWLKFREPLDFGLYGIYPANDYLWQQAAAAGVDRQTYKSLFHKPRKKGDCFNPQPE